MILAIDIGNTNVVIGGMDKNQVVFKGRMETNIRKTTEEMASHINFILDINNIEKEMITGAIISSVVPQLTDRIKCAVNRLLSVNCIVVGKGIKSGINIIMDQPHSVGTDMIVDAVAALSYLRPPILIFDLGTATTCSVIDKNRNYIGSIIAPGVYVSLNALAEKAAQLPYVQLEVPRNIIGKNTVDSMKSGIIYGHAGLIDGLIDRLNDELGEKASVVATGGVAEPIIAHCKNTIEYDENLILKGLNILYNKNVG